MAGSGGDVTGETYALLLADHIRRQGAAATHHCSSSGSKHLCPALTLLPSLSLSPSPGDVILGGEDALVLNTDGLAYLNDRFPAIERGLAAAVRDRLCAAVVCVVASSAVASLLAALSGDSFTPASYAFTRPEHDALGLIFEFCQILPALRVGCCAINRLCCVLKRPLA